MYAYTMSTFNIFTYPIFTYVLKKIHIPHTHTVCSRWDMVCHISLSTQEQIFSQSFGKSSLSRITCMSMFPQATGSSVLTVLTCHKLVLTIPTGVSSQTTGKHTQHSCPWSIGGICLDSEFTLHITPELVWDDPSTSHTLSLRNVPAQTTQLL